MHRTEAIPRVLFFYKKVGTEPEMLRATVKRDAAKVTVHIELRNTVKIEEANALGAVWCRFNVVQWLRTITHALKLTIVISLLQPQPEVLESLPPPFDSLCCLSPLLHFPSPSFALPSSSLFHRLVRQLSCSCPPLGRNSSRLGSYFHLRSSQASQSCAQSKPVHALYTTSKRIVKDVTAC